MRRREAHACGTAQAKRIGENAEGRGPHSGRPNRDTRARPWCWRQQTPQRLGAPVGPARAISRRPAVRAGRALCWERTTRRVSRMTGARAPPFSAAAPHGVHGAGTGGRAARRTPGPRLRGAAASRLAGCEAGLRGVRLRDPAGLAHTRKPGLEGHRHGQPENHHGFHARSSSLCSGRWPHRATALV